MQEDHYFTVLEKRLEFTKTLANYERELEALSKELAQNRFELGVMKKSLSWRMTAPLRYAADLVGKWWMPKLGKEIATLRSSDLFDSAWYLSQYPDVAERGVDPAEHYLRFGASEGRDPGPGFDTKWYRGTNPDVMRSGINPLLHYIRHGRAERRLPMP